MIWSIQHLFIAYYELGTIVVLGNNTTQSVVHGPVPVHKLFITSLQ